MSLNRVESALFAYLDSHPEERRHWQAKVNELTRAATRAAPEIARELERGLRDYLAERSEHVGTLREWQGSGARLCSLLNLAEYLLRIWGPPPKPKALSDAKRAAQ